MSKIEKMKRYIERTKLDDNDSYCIRCDEVMELARTIPVDGFPFNAINLAFKYGKAKGYRAAKAEARR